MLNKFWHTSRHFLIRSNMSNNPQQLNLLKSLLVIHKHFLTLYTQYESETVFLFFRKLISGTKICHIILLCFLSSADTCIQIFYFENLID